MIYVFIVFLLVSAAFDIRSQRIPSVIVWGFTIIMAGYRMVMYIEGDTSVGEIIGLLLPGIVLYALSFFSNEIGNGDGLLIVATGCYLGAIKNIGMIFFAFLLAAFISISLLISKRSMKNKRIPFAPFLLMASLIMVSGL